MLLRTAEEIGDAVRGNPFLAAGAPEDQLHVLFLIDLPGPGRVAALDPDRSRPDAFAVRGREVHLWLPNGVARSRLTNDYFDSKLATTSTGRNWRTILKLSQMTKGSLYRRAIAPTARLASAEARGACEGRYLFWQEIGDREGAVGEGARS